MNSSSIVLSTLQCSKDQLWPQLIFTALQCTQYCSTVLYCTVLYCTVLYCTVLYTVHLAVVGTKIGAPPDFYYG